VNRQIDDFERRKEREKREFEDWKARERDAILREREQLK